MDYRDGKESVGCQEETGSYCLTKLLLEGERDERRPGDGAGDSRRTVGMCSFMPLKTVRMVNFMLCVFY